MLEVHAEPSVATSPFGSPTAQEQHYCVVSKSNIVANSTSYMTLLDETIRSVSLDKS